MTRNNILKGIVGGLLLLVGILFAALPKDWIERTLGFEPDAGSGVLELAIAVVPIIVGLALLISLVFSLRHARATSASSPKIAG